MSKNEHPCLPPCTICGEPSHCAKNCTLDVPAPKPAPSVEHMRKTCRYSCVTECGGPACGGYSPTPAPATDLPLVVKNCIIRCRPGDNWPNAPLPVVIDGFISSAAALVATELVPNVKPYLIASHRSVEIGHQAIYKKMGLQPLLDLGMRLGEGSGAVLAFPIIDAAARLLDEMATFEEAGVSEKE